MKIQISIFAVMLTLLTIVNGTAYAQTPASRTPSTNTQDSEKTQNIKKLIEIVGGRTLYIQIINQTMEAMKSQYPQVPAKFWDTFAAELNPDEIINEVIPIYAKYFTNGEIQEIIAFYQSPLGKKTIKVLPQLSQESSLVGIKYGRKAAERALAKLEAEGYLSPRKFKK